MIASIAFELARLKFRREGKEYSGDDISIEAALIMFGFGVFNANSSIVKMETWSGDLRSGWNFKKGPSQIPPEAHGYLLALFSFFSREENPEWANFLDKEVNPHCSYPLRSSCFSVGFVFLVSSLCTTDFRFVKGWCLVWRIS